MRRTLLAHHFVKTCGFPSLDSSSTFFFSHYFSSLEWVFKNQISWNIIRFRSIFGWFWIPLGLPFGSKNCPKIDLGTQGPQEAPWRSQWAYLGTLGQTIVKKCSELEFCTLSPLQVDVTLLFQRLIFLFPLSSWCSKAFVLQRFPFPR